MTEPIPDSVERLRKLVADAFHAHWRLFMVQGVVMMVLGVIAVVLPEIATVATEIFIGWLFVIGGVLRTLMVFRARRAPGFWLSLLTALLALVLGVILILHPLQGVLTLTIVLIVMFLVEGLAAIVLALDRRRHLRHWGWTLFTGVVDVVLAGLIWQGWPATAAWAIGLLVGINMFMFGLSLVTTAVAARALGPR